MFLAKPKESTPVKSDDKVGSRRLSAVHHGLDLLILI
jgi:hypothetical protein